MLCTLLVIIFTIDCFCSELASLQTETLPQGKVHIWHLIIVAPQSIRFLEKYRGGERQKITSVVFASDSKFDPKLQNHSQQSV